ncbi:kinase-like protein [Lichtheimia hyalospora FSU 10163]|nr:kinase-like protein [Lichtheimia hyalospora FSU 10163]
MSAFAIAVFQTTATVAIDNNNAQVSNQPFVQVLNVVVETDTHILSLIRYVPDLLEFDTLIKTHYHRVKIPFPALSETSKTDKRRSFRQFLTSLSHHHSRSDSEKIQRYLQKCSVEPIVRSSSIFRDFFSAQRDEDQIISKIPKPRILTPEHADSSKDAIVPELPAIPHTKQRDIVPSPSPIVPEEVNDEEPIVPPNQEQHHEEKQQQQQQQEQEEIEPVQAIVHDSPAEQGAVNDYPTNYDYLADLEMIKVLGKGCMGKVFLVRSHKSNELYALKSIMKELVIEQREITHTLAERDILATMSGINHPFLAKLHASFQDTHRLYLVTDYYCGGDLATQMSTCSTFSKERILFYAAEMIEGIGELHRLDILYRDLKPENILLTIDGHVLLTDFGLSKWLHSDEQHMTQTFCGTAEYLAPEALLGEPYSFGVDYWAYGTILYEMLAGITPFWADNHSEMYRRVLQDPLEFPPDTDFETAEFLSALLERDPSMRLGVNGVDEIKSHIYFASISWDDVYHRRLIPPYVPDIRSSLDFSNFDPSFLEMPPVLTPVSSQHNLTQDMQQVFDGYSFVDERFAQDNQEPIPLQSPLVGDDSSGWDEDDELGSNNKRLTMDRIDEQQIKQEQLYNQVCPTVQPARKRGSISMLSDVDSFQLDNSDQLKSNHLSSHEYGSEETKRHAKRRNTSGHVEEDDHDEVAYAYRQQLSESMVVAEPLLINSNSSSSITHGHHHPPHHRNMPDLSLASTADDGVPLDELDFGGITEDLDLKLSFSVQIDQKKTSKPSNSSTTSSRRKARRFFSPLLRF